MDTALECVEQILVAIAVPHPPNAATPNAPSVVSGGPYTWFFVFPQDVVGKLRFGRSVNAGSLGASAIPASCPTAASSTPLTGWWSRMPGPSSFVMRYEDPSVDGAATLNDNPWIDFTANRPVLLASPWSKPAAR